ncbi:hypothetical protein JMS36_004694 [Salmonella enterica]|nr:hypothetical protein [Salmonella enterica]
MTFLFNVIFRILHMLMVLLPSQSAFKIWLRQMAEDALLMEHVAADIRLAGELFRLKSRYTGDGISAAEQTAERILRNAAYRLGCAIAVPLAGVDDLRTGASGLLCWRKILVRKPWQRLPGCLRL